MAFPQVADTNNSVVTTAATAHEVALPPNIDAGNLLIVFFVNDDDDAVTYPGGWTKFFDAAKAGDVRLSAAWRKADGEEGATIEVGTSGTEKSAHVSYRITGAADPNSIPPESSTGATGDSAEPDPDSLTGTGGAKDYLWIALEGNTDQDAVTDYPTDYDNGETYNAGLGTGSVSIGIARRELNAVSQDPAIFTIEFGEDWVAATLVVHPPGGEPTGTNMTVNVDDAHKDVATAYVNVDDAWKEVDNAYVNVDDAWKTIF